MSEGERGAPPVEGALVAVERSHFMPAMSIEAAVERYTAVTEFVSRVLRRDVDYGVIPGTEKFTLLKPGAEKLTTFFGLSTRFRLIERIEDWTGAAHDGEPFFYYLYRCQLRRDSLLVAEADGSCNSREQKYRYREAHRTCPECKQAAIIKGREEYGGGWVCFRKRGGCGAKFLTGDSVIESQPVGRVPNADIADQVNTIQKMGQKRALVAAVLIAVNASEFFTQDVEDFAPRAAPTLEADAQPTGASVNSANATTGAAAADTGDAKDASGAGGGLEAEILGACRALGRTEAQLSEWLRRKYAAEGLRQLSATQRREVLEFLRGLASKKRAA